MCSVVWGKGTLVPFFKLHKVDKFSMLQCGSSVSQLKGSNNKKFTSQARGSLRKQMAVNCKGTTDSQKPEEK
jgi:hypothetical protein